MQGAGTEEEAEANQEETKHSDHNRIKSNVSPVDQFKPQSLQVSLSKGQLTLQFKRGKQE
jgi:hypothetical protein